MRTLYLGLFISIICSSTALGQGGSGPSNDDCFGMEELSSPAIVDADTTGATNDGPPLEGFSGDGQIWGDIWYKLPVVETGDLTLRLISLGIVGPRIAVTPPVALAPMDCPYPFTEACGEEGATPGFIELQIPVTSGEERVIRIGHETGGMPGAFMLEVMVTPAGGPENDDCTNPTSIFTSGGAANLEVGLQGATDSGLLGDAGCPEAFSDVFFEIHPDTVGLLSVTITPSGSDPALDLNGSLSLVPAGSGLCDVIGSGDCQQGSGLSSLELTEGQLVGPGDTLGLRVGIGPIGHAGDCVIESSLVCPPPVLEGLPADQAVCEGADVSFTVTASALIGPITYQWFGPDGGALAGGTGPTLSLTGVTAAQAGVYFVDVSNPCGTVNTHAVLSVKTPPVIVTGPRDLDICTGEDIYFDVYATGSEELTYQWFYKGFPMSGEVGPSVSMEDAHWLNSGTFSVTVSNDCGEASASGELVVHTGPEIITQPTGGHYFWGDSHTLNVEAVGWEEPSYQWFKDGAPIPGATGSSLVLSVMGLVDEGVYKVEVTDDCGSVVSENAVVVVIATSRDIYEVESDSTPFAEPNPCPPCPKREENGTDPVHLFSGEFYLEEVDLQIPGRGMHFTWGRKYRSRVGPDTAQGTGWDFSYNLSLERADDDLLLNDGHSRQDRYELQSDGSWEDGGFFRRITEEPDGTYRVQFANKGIWEFHPFDGSSREGRIKAIEDRNSNRMEFEHNALGKLSLVRDTLDREITITYHSENGRIASVQDFIGRQVTYEYYAAVDSGGGEGDLASVTTPSVVGTPHGNDFPNGKTTTYTYSTGFSDEDLNHNLLTITDPKGQVRLVNEYDTSDAESLTYDHVLRQTWGDASDVIDIVYAEVTPDADNGQAVRKAILNDRVGNVREFFFDMKNRPVINRDYTGRADPDQPTTSLTGPGGNPPVNPLRSGAPSFYETRTEFNDDSLPIRILYPEGNEEVLAYDESNDNPRLRGNLLSRTLLPGPRATADQPLSRTETFEYNDQGSSGCCGTNFVKRHVDFNGNVTVNDFDDRGNRIRTTHPITSTVEDFDFNEFGQLVRTTLPDNDGHRRVDELVYYGPEAGDQEGYIVQRIVDATGFASVSTFEYDAVGNGTRVVDPAGKDTLLTFNALNQVVHARSATVTENADRYETFITYDANDNVILIREANLDETGAVRDNDHLDTIFEYETLNHMTRLESEVEDGRSVVEEFEYDANRNMVTHLKGEATKGAQPANKILTEYDERDLHFRITKAGVPALSSTDQMDYDANGNLTVVSLGIQSDPRITRTTFDGYDRIVSITDAMGNVSTLRYDANGNVISRRVDGELLDGLGSASNVRLAESSSEFDAMDRKTRIRILHFDPVTQGPIGDGESVEEIVWSGASLVLSVKNDNGHTATASHDTLLRISRLTDARGNTIDRTYDANSNLVSVTETELSDLGNLDLGGASQVFTTIHEYDELNRLVSTKNNVGSKWEWEYDSRSNMVRSVDSLGRVERYEFDGLNRLQETRRELGGGVDLVTSQAWDDSSRLISRTDPNGKETRYRYDPLNRQIREIFADGTSRVSEFDVHHNVTSGTDPNGTEFTATYDHLNRPLSTLFTSGPGVLGTTVTEQRTWDGLSHLVLAVDDDSTVSSTHDSMGNVLTETLNGRTTTNTHDGLGDRSTLTLPGGRSLQFTRDLLGRMKEIHDATVSSSSSLVGRYDYVGPSRVTRRTLGNGTVMDLTYDGITDVANPNNDLGERQIVDVHHHAANGTTLFQRKMTWDRVGNKTSGVMHIPGRPIDGERLHYDASDRLVRSEHGRSFSATPGPGPLQIARRRDRDYTLDGAGNRTLVQSSPVGALPGDGGYVSNSMNEYLQTPSDTRSYDANGNLAAIDPGAPDQRSMAYDVHNRMVEHTDQATGEVTQYFYDVLGRRIAKVRDVTGSPVTTLFFYDGWQVVEERDGSDNVLATFVYGNYIDEPLTMDRGGVEHWYHSDDLHNVRAVSDASGVVVERYDYDDFGQVTVRSGSGAKIAGSAIGNAYLFTGRRLDDETGWYFYRTRFLDPSIGKFTTQDSIGVWGDRANVGNGTAYVGNNPHGWTDPMGLWRDAMHRVAAVNILDGYKQRLRESNPNDKKTRAYLKDRIDLLEQVIRLEDAKDFDFDHGKLYQKELSDDCIEVWKKLESLETISPGASQPKELDILNDPNARIHVNNAWLKSNPHAPAVDISKAGSRKRETWGWLYWDKSLGRVFFVFGGVSRIRDGADPMPPIKETASTKVLALVHVHPNTKAEGYRTGPSGPDVAFQKSGFIVDRKRVYHPGIVLDHEYSPPQRRPTGGWTATPYGN